MEEIYPGRDHTGRLGKKTRRWSEVHTDKIIVPEITAPSGNPDTDTGWLYAKVDGTTTKLYFEDQDGTVNDLLAAASGDNTLDEAYDQGGAGAGRTINATDGAVIITSTDADTTNILEIDKSPSAGAAGDGIDITMGANATGAAIDINNSGSGNDIQGDNWSIAKTGAATLVSASISGTATIGTLSSSNIGGATVTGGLNLNDSSGDSPALTLTDGTGETAVIQKTDGSVLNITTVAADGVKIITGNLWVGNGTPGTASMDGEDFYVNGDSEFDGTVQFDGVATFSSVPVVTAASVTLRNNETFSIAHATNGAADDLTIDLTGATDSSIILNSSGTGEDAIKLNASAGGVDIDALAAKDVNIAGGQVALVSKDDAASAISLTANVGTSETIVVTNTQGTSESAITINAAAGGVNIDAAAAKDVDIAGGQVLISSKTAGAKAIGLTSNQGASDTIDIINSQGTGAASIAITATAGGVDIDAAAALDVNIAGGQVALVSKDNAASAIALTTNIGTSETIVVTNTQGTDAAAINLNAAAGGITAAVAAGKAITLNGTTNVKHGADIASPAGGELTLGDGTYFDITGNNNITSIAAASSTNGRMVILRFEGTPTFTDGGNLKIAGNFVTSADDTITLICDGTDWYEMCRSAN
ncbi:MAG: hypothetical protein WC373_06650 [Smithella sp.]|jgi:hypothetical protein